MTTRKKSGKSKSRRNGRTKRGGFFGIFDDSFSWFSSKNKLDEVKPTSDNKPFDWTFGLKDKLNPPPVPAGQPVIPGRLPQPQPQGVPDATQDSTTQAAAAAPEQTSQAAASQPASQAAAASQAVPVTPVKGGSRLRVRTKKRSCSCRCKRK
jgi:hypothetical protein